jgi:hypothetical protein
MRGKCRHIDEVFASLTPVQKRIIAEHDAIMEKLEKMKGNK